MKFCPECERDYSDEHEVCPEDGSRLVFLGTEQDTLVGQTIDERYTLTERIGEGGMGAVYIGKQAGVGRTVAIKVLRRDLADDPSAVKRFFHEAKVVSRLRHPNTVTLYDFGQSDAGLLYIAMEHMTGRRLDTLIDDRSLTLPEIIEVVDQVCQSLVEAHGDGIVHRDLKPENIFIDSVGSHNIVKVLDFGIAKVQGVTTNLTLTGMVFGTPAYMSPEQAQGFELDRRSDLYSLGVILFELLCGRLPFQDTSAMRLAIKHILDPIPKVAEHSLYQPLPPGLVDLVTRMLAKTPLERPASAEDVRSAIATIRREIESGSSMALRARVRNGSSDAVSESTTGAASGHERSLLVALRERLSKSEDVERPLEDTGPNRVGQIYTTAQYSDRRKAVAPEVVEQVARKRSRRRAGARLGAAVVLGLCLILALVLLLPAENDDGEGSLAVAPATGVQAPAERSSGPGLEEPAAGVDRAASLTESAGEMGGESADPAALEEMAIILPPEAGKTDPIARTLVEGLSGLRGALGAVSVVKRLGAVAVAAQGVESATDELGEAIIERAEAVTIRFELRPDNATVRRTVDNERLCTGDECSALSLPFSDQPVELRITRRRYEDAIVEVVPDRDQTVDVRLTRTRPRAGDRRDGEGSDEGAETTDGESDDQRDGSSESTSPLMPPVTIPD